MSCRSIFKLHQEHAIDYPPQINHFKKRYKLPVSIKTLLQKKKKRFSSSQLIYEKLTTLVYFYHVATSHMSLVGRTIEVVKREQEIAVLQRIRTVKT